MSCWQLGQKAAMKVMAVTPLQCEIFSYQFFSRCCVSQQCFRNYITTRGVVIEVFIVVEQYYYTVCHTDGHVIYFADKSVASLPRKCYTVYETTRFCIHTFIYLKGFTLMVKKKLQSMALACATAGTTLVGSMGATVAQAQQAETPQPQPQDTTVESTSVPGVSLGDEKAASMDQWVKGLNLRDIAPSNVTVYIPPSGMSTPVHNPAIPTPGGIHQQATMTKYPKNVTLTLPYNALWTTGVFTYNESRDSGVRAAKMALRAIHAQVPNARIHLYGYSEGADVGAHVVESISRNQGPIPKHVFGSAAFQGNPVRSNAGTHRAGGAPNGKGLFSPANYGDQAGKVMEVCTSGDVVCNASNIAPNIYYLYEDAIANSAPLRGKVSLREAVRRANPQVVARSGLEIPAAVQGWVRHTFGYVTIDQGARNAGENFIKAHYK